MTLNTSKQLSLGSNRGERQTLDESCILLPQDYRAVESPFAVVEVVHCSGENGTLWGTGLQLVVEAHMLRDIQHNGETFTVIKENHVIGILSDS